MNSLDRMKYRLDWKGYDIHDKEIVQSKYKTFQEVLKRSYQAEFITLNKGTDKEVKWRCLINSSRLTEQFDKKIISIDYDSGLREGTIFYWDRTQEYWLVTMQQWTEEAYFRGSISKCSYEIDVDGTKYWAVVSGPDERTTEWYNNHRTIFNGLNYNMVIQITKDSKTVDYFSRHQIIKVKMFFRNAENPDEILTREDNWRVVATDKYSSDNVIDVYVDEYYNNQPEDIKQQQEIERKEYYEAKQEMDSSHAHIEGPRDVNVLDEGIQYMVLGASSGKWEVNSKKIELVPGDSPQTCTVNVLARKSGSFVLSFVSDNDRIDYLVRINSF